MPKGEGLTAADVRPITVTSVVYRVWAARRVRKLIEWQEGWLHKAISSYRPGHGCDDVWFTQALLIEEALITSKPLAGLSIDFTKAFDRVPTHILFRLAERLGVEGGILKGVTSLYAQMRRHWKVGGFIGQAFTSTNGILQGCPLSVVLLNMLIHVWAATMDNENPESSPEAYADDLSITTRSVRAIRKGLAITQ